MSAITFFIRRFPIRVITVFRLIQLGLLNRFGTQKIGEHPGPIVSMTTHGSRLKTVYLAIESIVSGTGPSPAIYLWVTEDSQVPNSLIRLQKRGLRIIHKPDRKVHMKWIFCASLPTEEINQGVILADDDLLYPRDWYQSMLTFISEFPGVNLARRCRKVTLSDDGILHPYPWSESGFQYPSPYNFATASHGMYLCPEFLDLIDTSYEKIQNLAPTADDMWMWAEMIRTGFYPRALFNRIFDLPEIPNLNSKPLGKINNKGGANQRMLAAIVNDDVYASSLRLAFGRSVAFEFGSQE